MTIQHYDEYKDSGIPWLGQIPEHWEVRRLKTLASIKTGSTPPTNHPEYFEGEYCWYTPGDFSPFSLHLASSKRSISHLALMDKEAVLYPEYSILMIGIGATLGRIAIPKERCYANQQVNVIIPKEPKNQKYIAYFFSVNRDYIWNSANTATMPILNQEATKELLLPLPPLSEQESIVRYLEERCGEIDHRIERAKRRVELLQELKQSIITEAVTRGLDHTVPTRDSGIAWLGQIPEHWEVCRLKNKYTFKTGATPDSGKSEFYDGEIKWANISDLNGGVVYDTAKHITEDAVKACSMSVCPKGSLMYSFKLSVGQVAFCGDDMYTNEAIATFEPQRESLRYLYYIAPIFIKQNSNTNIYGALLLNQDLIKNAIVSLPPHSEQEPIVRYLEERCGEVDQRIERAKRRVELLQELKQSIITEAVTGKIKVG